MEITYSAILKMFKDEISVFERGEKHLHSTDFVQFSKSDNHYMLKVRASMKKIDYNVEVS